jgi:cytochrome o ubiquinol oxidase subunit II
MTAQTFTTKWAKRLAAAAVPLFLSGCDMVVMNPTGDIARQQRDLILVATGLMLLVIVPVLTLIVVFALRYRKGKNPQAYDPGFTHSTRIELVVWSIPLIIIGILGAITWVTTHKLDPFRPLDRISYGRPIPAGTKPLEIDVVAMDWKWLFIYPEQGIASVNELALPIDVPVTFKITSTSQMNTFYAPTLAGMVYAMPGMQSMLHAVLNKPGDTWGYSGNYTGAGYTDMRFQLHGVDQAGFDSWVAKVKSSPDTLNTERYVALDVPSEKVPVMHFGNVPPDIFLRAVNQCVAPGAPCKNDVMRIDATKDGATHGDMTMAGDMASDAHPMDAGH